MAAAAAAGLNRNGIRRTAFSTGDLQALSVLPNKNSPSPPDPANANLHRYTTSCQIVAKLINDQARTGSAAVYCRILSCMTIQLLQLAYWSVTVLMHCSFVGLYHPAQYQLSLAWQLCQRAPLSTQACLLVCRLCSTHQTHLCKLRISVACRLRSCRQS